MLPPDWGRLFGELTAELAIGTANIQAAAAWIRFRR